MQPSERTIEPSNIAELPALLAARVPEKCAVRVESDTLTYRQLDETSQAIARALLRDGVRQGDRVAVLGRDSTASVCVLFGIARAGAVCVPINWRLTSDEITHVLRDSEAAWIFVDRELAALCATPWADHARPPRCVGLDGAAAGCPSLSEWLRPSAAHIALPSRYDANDVIVQMYTSGTSGRPKGVLLAHRTFFVLPRALADSGAPWLGWSEHDRALMFLPTFHIGGLYWLIRGLALGSTHTILQHFEPSRVFATIASQRITLTGMVPAMLQSLLRDPRCAKADLSSVRALLYGGAPIAPAVLQHARSVFRCQFYQIYGMTETGNMAVMLDAAAHASGSETRLLAAGRPLPGVEARIVTPAGRTAAVGEVGEIWLKSPAQMLGYWKLPEATRATLVDGWMRTGDGGYRDADGFIHICDRLQDMIIIGGENVYPAEIERVLRTHPDVVDTAVVGVPHDISGETSLAFIVARPGARPGARELMQHARQALADYKVPRRYECVEALPRNSAGKVLRHQLREPYWRGRTRRVN